MQVLPLQHAWPAPPHASQWVVVPDVAIAFYAAALKGAQDVLERAGYQVLVMNTEREIQEADLAHVMSLAELNRTVRDRLGTRKASFAPAEVTAELTGMQIGGVTVFGLPDSMPIWVDARVMARDRIILGGGSRSWKVIASPSILEHLAGVEVVDGLAGEAAPRVEAE